MGGRQEATGGDRRRRPAAGGEWGPARRMTRDEVGPVERSHLGLRVIGPGNLSSHTGPSGILGQLHFTHLTVAYHLKFNFAIYIYPYFFSKNLSHNASLIIF